MFGFQHVAPFVSKKLVTENGRAYVERQPGQLAADPAGDDRHEQGGRDRQEAAGRSRQGVPAGEQADLTERYAATVTMASPASWQSRQRASYCSFAPTTIVSPE